MSKTDGHIEFERQLERLDENEGFPDLQRMYSFEDMRSLNNDWSNTAYWIFIGTMCGCFILNTIIYKILNK
jgi:hypothetical protein